MADKQIINTALVQHPPVFLNMEATLELFEQYLDEANREEADLVVFPETWFPGYPVWLDYAPEAGLWDHPPAKNLYRILFDNSLSTDHPSFEKIVKAVAKADTHVVLGMHERKGNTLYNTMVFFSPDGSWSLHRKLMPTYTERLVWGMGDGSTLNAVDTDFGTLGGLICWEHWMPLARTAMHARQETVHVAQWPWVKELHQLCSRHYAFEGQCFVVASGCAMSKQDMLDGLDSLDPDEVSREAVDLIESIPAENDELVLKGGSAIIAPDTRYLLEPACDRKEILYCNVDLSSRPEGHLFLDTDGHYARPDVFQLKVDTSEKNQVEFDD